MIDVRYLDRLGNNLFQYCLGRILAEELGQELRAQPIAGFPGTTEHVAGTTWGGEPLVLSGQEIPFQEILRAKPQQDIVLRGHFQQYAYYRPYKDRIRQWLATAEPATQPGENDLVIHLRRDDYIVNEALLPMSYFQQAIGMQSYKTVWVCTDDYDDPFLVKFCQQTGAVAQKKTMMEDFLFMRSAHAICLSQSTFSWWAAFLSDAKTIYFPLPPTGFWSGEWPDIQLRVDDEDRYTYLPVKERYRLSIREWLYIRRKQVWKRLRKMWQRMRAPGMGTPVR